MSSSIFRSIAVVFGCVVALSVPLVALGGDVPHPAQQSTEIPEAGAESPHTVAEHEPVSAILASYQKTHGNRRDLPEASPAAAELSPRVVSEGKVDAHPLEPMIDTPQDEPVVASVSAAAVSRGDDFERAIAEIEVAKATSNEDVEDEQDSPHGYSTKIIPLEMIVSESGAPPPLSLGVTPHKSLMDVHEDLNVPIDVSGYDESSTGLSRETETSDVHLEGSNTEDVRGGVPDEHVRDASPSVVGPDSHGDESTAHRESVSDEWEGGHAESSSSTLLDVGPLHGDDMSTAVADEMKSLPASDAHDGMLGEWKEVPGDDDFAGYASRLKADGVSHGNEQDSHAKTEIAGYEEISRKEPSQGGDSLHGDSDASVSEQTLSSGAESGYEELADSLHDCTFDLIRAEMKEESESIRLATLDAGKVLQAIIDRASHAASPEVERVARAMAVHLDRLDYARFQKDNRKVSLLVGTVAAMVKELEQVIESAESNETAGSHAETTAEGVHEEGSGAHAVHH